VGNTLKYAVLNGENWDIQAIDVSDSDIGYSMALDSNGNPHVVYSKFNDSLKSNTRDSYFGDIKYAVFDGTNWLLETIDSIELSSFYYSNISPSITLDSSNDPHIMYANTFEHQFYDKNIIPSHLGSESLHNVKYATWKESKWLVQTILTNTSRISNLVLDSKGQPSFCYERGNLPESGSFQTSSLMNYAYLDGQVWLSRVIDSNPSPSSPTLNLDSNNNPQVYFYHENYQNPNDEGLICARWNSFGWSTQNLGSIPPNSFYQYTAHINDFAFNSNGSLGLTYYGEVGTIRGAAVWGGLTYASLESASSNSTGSQNPSLFVLSPKQIIIIIVVVLAVAVIAALLYRRHRHECLR
jgi:hypothetical protein